MVKTLYVVIFLLWSSQAHSQLGPKDRTGLPPTDLQRIAVGDEAPDFTLENIDGRATGIFPY